MTTRDRLLVAGAIAAAAAVAVSIVLVFAFGRHDPSPPSLRDHPNAAIPGEIAYIDDDGCIVRAAASGLSREQSYCLPDNHGGPITWLDDHTVGVVMYDQRGGTLREIDLDTRQERDTDKVLQPGKGPLDPSFASINGETVSIEQHGAVFVVGHGARTKIADFDVAEYGGPQFTAWSPDGQWMLLQYYPRHGGGGPELWILSRGGKTAGTLATATRGQTASWRIDGVGISPVLTFH